jgi:hypothetical protein
VIAEDGCFFLRVIRHQISHAAEVVGQGPQSTSPASAEGSSVISYRSSAKT